MRLRNQSQCCSRMAAAAERLRRRRSMEPDHGSVHTLPFGVTKSGRSAPAVDEGPNPAESAPRWVLARPDDADVKGLRESRASAAPPADTFWRLAVSRAKRWTRWLQEVRLVAGPRGRAIASDSRVRRDRRLRKKQELGTSIPAARSDAAPAARVYASKLVVEPVWKRYAAAQIDLVASTDAIA